MDKPPEKRVRYRVWKRALVDTTRQLKLGADRARDGETLELLDGMEVVRRVQTADMECEAAVEETCDVEEWMEEGYLSEEECREVGDQHEREEWEQAERELGRRCAEAEEAQERASTEQPYWGGSSGRTSAVGG